MQIKPFIGLLPKLDMVSSVDSFFATVKEDFVTYREGGFFDKKEKALLYLYEIQQNGHTYRGVLAANDINDIGHRILKHERTLAAKEQHMLRLTIERRAQIKPVLLAHDPVEALDAFLTATMSGKPDHEILFDGSHEVHRLWEVSSPKKQKRLIELFEHIPHAYIADGHHRCATSLNLNKSSDDNNLETGVDELLVLYVSFDDLLIHDFNRIVHVSDIMSTSRLMALLTKYFKIKAMPKRKKPKRKHDISCYVDGHWYRLRWKKKILRKAKTEPIFDTDLLNKYVLNGILNIKDVRSDPRIEYKSGAGGLKPIKQVVQKDPSKVAFCLYPVLAEDLKQVVDQGKTLPPKSTWFEPRVKNGMVCIEM